MSFHISWVSKESSSSVHSSGILTWATRLKTASAAIKTSLFFPIDRSVQDVNVVTDLKSVRWKFMVACFLTKHTRSLLCVRQRAVSLAVTRVTVLVVMTSLASGDANTTCLVFQRLLAQMWAKKSDILTEILRKEPYSLKTNCRNSIT
jgi:hypothetical protein